MIGTAHVEARSGRRLARKLLLAVAGGLVLSSCGDGFPTDGGPRPSWETVLYDSFEIGGQPRLEGWTLGNVFISLRQEGSPGSGQWCLELPADWVPTTTTASRVVPDIGRGGRLRLSADVRALGEAGGARIELVVRDESSVTEITRTSTDESNWTRLSVEGTVRLAESESVWVILSAFSTESMARIGLVDNVRVQIHR